MIAFITSEAKAGVAAILIDTESSVLARSFRAIVCVGLAVFSDKPDGALAGVLPHLIGADSAVETDGVLAFVDVCLALVAFKPR